MNSSPDAHTSPAVLAAYAADEMAEEQKMAVDVHLGVCPECAAVATDLRLLRNAVTNWHTRGYGEAYERASLSAALAEAESQAQDGGVRERLRVWRERWAGRAEAAVGMIVERTGEGPRLFIEGLEGAVVPGGDPFRLAPAGATPARGAVGEGADSGPTGVRVTVAVRGEPDGARTTIELDPEQADLHIRIDGWPEDREPPFFLLREGKRSVSLRAPEPRDGSFVTTFESVPAGTYVVEVEPGDEPSQ